MYFNRALFCFTILLGLPLVSATGWGAIAEAQEAMTLRVNDAAARPGELAAVVLRTYSARPIGQGQVCIVACLGQAHQDGQLPFDDLEDAIVFSEYLDVISITTFETDEGTQTAIIEFTSELAGVNLSDGPMAAFFLRLGAGATPGQEIDLVLDPANTVLFDADGNAIEIEYRSGSLLVLDPQEPYEVDASGAGVPPGVPAVLAVETEESFPIRSGQVGFRYPPELAAGVPVVSMDPRYGNATFTADTSIPGLVRVSFDSPDLSLNRLPGGFISIWLPTRADIPVGHRARVFLDPDLSFLEGADGSLLPLSLGDDELVFEPLEPIFSNGFESGNMGAWSLAVP